MAVMTYVCKYTPLELMLAFGAGFEAPNNDVPDFSKSEPLIHQNLWRSVPASRPRTTTCRISRSPSR